MFLAAKQGRNQQIFCGGRKDYKLLLDLTTTHVFENLGVGNCPVAPPLVAGLQLSVTVS